MRPNEKRTLKALAVFKVEAAGKPRPGGEGAKHDVGGEAEAQDAAGEGIMRGFILRRMAVIKLKEVWGCGKLLGLCLFMGCCKRGSLSRHTACHTRCYKIDR
jgi:hypothetical protein